MQIICTSLQTSNHTSTSLLISYRLDALPDVKPTVSKHWRQTVHHKKEKMPNTNIFCFISHLCWSYSKLGSTQTEPLGITGAGFLQPFMTPTNSVKALKQSLGTESNHGKSSTGFLFPDPPTDSWQNECCIFWTTSDSSTGTTKRYPTTREKKYKSSFGDWLYPVKIIHWPHLFMIHELTLDRMNAAPFMSAMTLDAKPREKYFQRYINKRLFGHQNDLPLTRWKENFMDLLQQTPSSVFSLTANEQCNEWMNRSTTQYQRQWQLYTIKHHHHVACQADSC